MKWVSKFSQRPTLPKIDLTRLKSYSDNELKSIVTQVPFSGFRYLDYTDYSNINCTNWIFKPLMFDNPRDSFNTMLRTLNFIQ